MARNLTRLVMVVLAVPMVLMAATKLYDVVPYRNCIGVTDSLPPNNRVSQTFVNVVDSLTMVSVWVADADTHSYHVDVLDSATPTLRVAYGDTAAAGPYCGWLTFKLHHEEYPVRGKTYKVVVSRPTGSPISFAYDSTNPYDYGCLSVGGQQQGESDLALRIYGTHQVVDSSWFGYVIRATPGDQQGFKGTLPVFLTPRVSRIGSSLRRRPSELISC